MQAIILGGGKGTRLSSVLNGLPKPLVKIADKPLLEHQIDLLVKNYFTEILILADYESSTITDFILLNAKWTSISIKILNDGDIPLGTGGALIKHCRHLNDVFLVVYGDTYFNIDINSFLNFHTNTKSDLTLFTHPNSHPYDSDIIVANEDAQVLRIDSYPHNNTYYSANLVNAAFYVCSKKVIHHHVSMEGTFIDFAKGLIPLFLQAKFKITSYKSYEYIKDCGTPSRLKQISNDILFDVPSRRSLSHKKPVVVLDRDGTIIENISFLSKTSQVRLLQNAAEGIKILNDLGVIVAIATNQPVVARGEVTFEELHDIHSYLEWLLGYSGAFVDVIEFCPHHPDRGFSGEISNLKVECRCRKPNVGMLEKIFSTVNGDVSNSYLIGDTTSDILAANRFGLQSFLVKSGCCGNDKKFNVAPTRVFSDLLDASLFIKNQILNNIK
jgi:histidinol-phosphate phosphatase family protein